MRSNKVQVCHYMTNIDSCGNNAKASIRKNFDQIIERVLHVIKHGVIDFVVIDADFNALGYCLTRDIFLLEPGI